MDSQNFPIGFVICFLLKDCSPKLFVEELLMKIICQMCEQEGHEADECSWVYSSCTESDYDVVTSHTSRNLGRKYLKCQYGVCKSGLKWLDEAIIESSKTICMLRNECFKCGELGHWMDTCPWLNLKCDVKGCKDTKTLITSLTSQTYGWRYLKCGTCGHFEWLKDANKKKKDNQTTITINISPSEFFDRFEASTSFSKNMEK